MDLHPYDGRERRSRDTDVDLSPGIAALAQVLRIARPLPDGVRYDLSFYGGGVGVP